ncbi:MAG: RNA polymerase sigma factor [Eubacteriales bacterium]|nr:RNA polymerase sigma factor [Eubacteriales bacterium]
MTIEELTQCVDTYGSDIYSFCRHLTRSTAEGEELYQETFLKAVELAEKIDMHNNPKSYLISISIRLWRNKCRKQGWQKSHTENQSMEILRENGQELCDCTSHSPEEQCIDRELHALVVQCVDTLPALYRMPVCLYYSAELSIKEISTMLKLPEGTVKRRLHRARTLLKKQLEDAGYE